MSLICIILSTSVPFAVFRPFSALLFPVLPHGFRISHTSETRVAINYTGGMTRPIQQAVPLTGLELRVDASILQQPVKNAKALVTGKGLSLHHEQDQLRLALSTINEYEVVLLQ